MLYTSGCGISLYSHKTKEQELVPLADKGRHLTAIGESLHSFCQLGDHKNIRHSLDFKGLQSDKPGPVPVRTYLSIPWPFFDPEQSQCTDTGLQAGQELRGLLSGPRIRSSTAKQGCELNNCGVFLLRPARLAL